MTLQLSRPYLLMEASPWLGRHDEGGLLTFIRSAPLKAAEGGLRAAQIGRLIQSPGFTGNQPSQVRTQFASPDGRVAASSAQAGGRGPIRSLHRRQVSPWRKLPSPEAGQEACGMCDCPSSFSRTSLLTNEASGLTYWHLLLPKYGQARDPFPRLTDPESSRRRPTS